MKYLDYALIAALMMLSTFPSWGMCKDPHEIRFPNQLEIADALNHRNNFFNEQNILFTVETSTKDYPLRVKSVEITDLPTWQKPSVKDSVIPGWIYGGSLKRNYSRHFAINLPVKITFFSHPPSYTHDTLTIDLFLPDIEGFPTETMILGNQWNPANFAVVTPLRKAFYMRQKNQNTFLCPVRPSRSELLPQLHIFFRTINSPMTGFDFAGTSWFIREDVRRMLLDWDSKYTILAIDLAGSPQFTYENDLLKARCLYKMVLTDGNQFYPFEFSLSTFIHK